MGFAAISRTELTLVFVVTLEVGLIVVSAVSSKTSAVVSVASSKTTSLVKSVRVSEKVSLSVLLSRVVLITASVVGLEWDSVVISRNGSVVVMSIRAAGVDGQ